MTDKETDKETQTEIEIFETEAEIEAAKTLIGGLTPTQLAWLAGLLQADGTFTADIRKRSKSDSPDYEPPPPNPKVILEMIQLDLMEYVGKMVDQNVVEQKRKTRADNTVYRITVQARKKQKSY